MTGGSLYVTRPTMGDYLATREELLWRAGDVFGALVDGSLDVRIGGRYALADAADAHRDLEARRTTGKLGPAPLTVDRMNAAFMHIQPGDGSRTGRPPSDVRSSGCPGPSPTRPGMRPGPRPAGHSRRRPTSSGRRSVAVSRHGSSAVPANLAGTRSRNVREHCGRRVREGVARSEVDVDGSRPRAAGRRQPAAGSRPARSPTPGVPSPVLVGEALGVDRQPLARSAEVEAHQLRDRAGRRSRCRPHAGPSTGTAPPAGRCAP